MANLAAYSSFFQLFPTDKLQAGDNDTQQTYGGQNNRTQGLPTPIPVIGSLQKDLSSFGYSINQNDGVTPMAVYDTATQKAVERFQRHVFSGARVRTITIDGRRDKIWREL